MSDSAFVEFSLESMKLTAGADNKTTSNGHNSAYLPKEPTTQLPLEEEDKEEEADIYSNTQKLKPGFSQGKPLTSLAHLQGGPQITIQDSKKKSPLPAVNNESDDYSIDDDEIQHEDNYAGVEDPSFVEEELPDEPSERQTI